MQTSELFSVQQDYDNSEDFAIEWVGGSFSPYAHNDDTDEISEDITVFVAPLR
jgi:hypothetical protein